MAIPTTPELTTPTSGLLKQVRGWSPHPDWDVGGVWAPNRASAARAGRYPRSVAREACRPTAPAARGADTATPETRSCPRTPSGSWRPPPWSASAAKRPFCLPLGAVSAFSGTRGRALNAWRALGALDASADGFGDRGRRRRSFSGMTPGCDVDGLPVSGAPDPDVADHALTVHLDWVLVRRGMTLTELSRPARGDTCQPVRSEDRPRPRCSVHDTECNLRRARLWAGRHPRQEAARPPLTGLHSASGEARPSSNTGTNVYRNVSPLVRQDDRLDRPVAALRWRLRDPRLDRR